MLHGISHAGMAMPFFIVDRAAGSDQLSSSSMKTTQRYLMRWSCDAERSFAIEMLWRQ
jgi:hypothetical protein